ncbi:MAG: PH domain-containing protein [Thiotrichaceae bacterium]
MEGEKELYRKNLSMFRNHPLLYLINLVVIGAGLGLVFTSNAVIATSKCGVGVVVWLSWWLAAISVTLTVTDKRTILRKGVLSKYTNEVFHTSVRNIEITQTIMQRIFNVGDIVVASSSGQADLEIAVHGIPDPETVKQLINKYRMAASDNKKFED